MSSLRRKENPDFEGRQLLMADEMPLLMLPTNNVITINTDFVIEGKPWKVVEYDNITNKGITYYYLERYFNKVETLPEPPVVEPTVQAFSAFAIEENSINNFILKPMFEYIFSTEDAYFAATPSVEILSRDNSAVKVRIPLGLTEIAISYKQNGQLVEKLYQVVL
jgi:hypothetical protein